MHKTAVVNELLPLGSDGVVNLPQKAVAAVVVKNAAGTTTYTLNTDYTVDPLDGKIKRVAGGTIPAGTLASPTTLSLSYDWADPSKVTPADIVGSINAAGKRLGLKAFRDSYQLFGFYPKLLLAPVFSTQISVSSELIVQATALRAIAFLDAPIGITPQQAITGRGPAGSINFNTSSQRAALCYPHVKMFDQATNTEQLRPLSTLAAGAQSRKDQDNGYWWSLSNTELLGVTGMERSIDAMINDPNSEANLLNEAGIITLFNSFGTGIRVWGNRSAAWPSESHPKNFINVRRVADVIAESLEYFSLQFIDRPLDNALIDAIMESGNSFMRKLIGDGAVIDGKVWYDKTLNEPTELANGHVTFSYDFMPPTPCERITYQASINIEYLRSLGST